MHFESRPVWRYQWPALIVSMLTIALAIAIVVLGPTYVGARATQLVASAAGALGLYFALLSAYRRWAWYFLIDDRNIESYHGVLARHVQSIRIQDLRNVNVHQTVMQRLLGVGDVQFSSAAGGDVEVVFFGVPEPMRVKELAQRLQGEMRPAPG